MLTRVSVRTSADVSCPDICSEILHGHPRALEKSVAILCLHDALTQNQTKTERDRAPSVGEERSPGRLKKGTGGVGLEQPINEYDKHNYKRQSFRTEAKQTKHTRSARKYAQHACHT